MSSVTLDVEKQFQLFREADDNTKFPQQAVLMDCLANARGHRLIVAAYNMIPLVGAVLSRPGLQVVTLEQPVPNLKTAEGILGHSDEGKLELITNCAEKIVEHYGLVGYRMDIGGITDIISYDAYHM